VILGWKDLESVNIDGVSLEEEHKITRTHNQKEYLKTRQKTWSKTLFASATPANYELELSHCIAEQIIRPTGLLDPITYVYPKSWDYDLLLKSVDNLLKKKPHLAHLFKGYAHKDEDFKEIFGGVSDGVG